MYILYTHYRTIIHEKLHIASDMVPVYDCLVSIERFYRNGRSRSNRVTEQEMPSHISLLSSTLGLQGSVRYVENPSPANMVPTIGDILIGPPMLFHSSDMIAGIPKMPGENGRSCREVYEKTLINIQMKNIHFS